MSEQKTFTFSSGLTVRINRISGFAYQAIQSFEKPPRPEIPIDVAELKGGGTQRTPNPDHPDYVKAMKDYRERVAELEEAGMQRLLRYMFTLGIVDNPPEEWIESRRRFIKNPHPDELKYLWISEQMWDIEDSQKLSGMIAGQVTPTEEGIAESEEMFPADGEQGNSDQELSVGEQEQGVGSPADPDGGTVS